MDSGNLETGFEELNSLLSRLHTDLITLEGSYFKVLAVLSRLKTVTELEDLPIFQQEQNLQEEWDVLLRLCEQLNRKAGQKLIDIDCLVLGRVGAISEQSESSKVVPSLSAETIGTMDTMLEKFERA